MKIGDKVLVRATIIEVDPATSDKYFVRVQFRGDNKKEWIVSQDVMLDPSRARREALETYRNNLRVCGSKDQWERRPRVTWPRLKRWCFEHMDLLLLVWGAFCPVLVWLAVHFIRRMR